MYQLSLANSYSKLVLPDTSMQENLNGQTNCNSTIACTHDKVVNHTDTIKYEEIYCPNCDGIGQVKMSAGSRVVFGILTLGPGALCDTESCSMCNGTGIVKRRVLNK